MAASSDRRDPVDRLLMPDRPLESDHTALAEQLEFERFITELSLELINLSDGCANDAVRNALRRMCEQIGLDQGAFLRRMPDGALVNAVAWTAPGIPPLEDGFPRPTNLPWTNDRLAAGQAVSFSTVEEIPNEQDRAALARLGVKSAVLLSLAHGDRVAGVLQFGAVRRERTWTPPILDRLRVLASVFEQMIARQERDAAVEAASREVEQLKELLHAETAYLRREEHGLARLVGQSTAMQRVLDLVEQVAVTDSTVLLLGETGTGKEMFATHIHELGPRRGRVMVRVNCAAIPPTLIESELFGRERGAFTGALARQIGRFELADRSTIFLDEIGDLPADVQVKLLRVLEERTIERLGSPRPIPVDVRIVAATHRNLEQRVSNGTFREDLYYRLNVFPIHVPPLRQRVEDIPLLAWRFVEEFSKAFGKRIDSIDNENMAALQAYHWPGNIRELRNAVERAMIVATGRRLTIAVPRSTTTTDRRSTKLIDVERDHIHAVLESTDWRIRGVGGAADRLGLKPTTLETRMAKLGLKRPGNT